MPLVGLEPKISAGERPKTYALDRAATGAGTTTLVNYSNVKWVHVLIEIKPAIFDDRLGTPASNSPSLVLNVLDSMEQNSVKALQYH
jgi:hypothetical protein